MRLWHLGVFILMLSLVMTIGRDVVGRVALIVFFTALGEFVFGTTAVMALFQTISEIGMARGLFEHGQAVAATTLVLVIATAVMSIWLSLGAWLLQVVVP